MRSVFIAEQLTGEVLARFAPWIATASACTAILAWDSDVSSRVFPDPRWLAGTVPLWDAAKDRLAAWTRRFVFEQSAPGLATRTERGLLAAGLDARLRMASLGAQFHDHAVREAGLESGEVELVLAADDPYLRDLFAEGRWLTIRPSRLRMAGLSGRLSAPRRALRERLAGSRSFRIPPWRRGPDRATALAGGGSQRTVLVVTQARRSVTELLPALDLLERRGWRIVITPYGRDFTDQHTANKLSSQVILPFDDASAGWRAPALPRQRWTLTEESMRECPVSTPLLHHALDAVCTTGAVQIAQHQRVLEVVRPQVIFSYGADLPSLALQIAADRLGIPTIFKPHNLEPHSRWFYYFFTTATALYGPTCARLNELAPDGARNTGLVPTGHPPYDAMMAELDQAGTSRRPLPGLVSPPSRPYLVLALAGWGLDLICHLQQERFMRMLVDALPDDAYLLCKLHPGRDERAICQRLLAAGLPNEAFRVIDDREYSTGELLAACDVAISNWRSNVIIDAIVAGRPVIGVEHPEGPQGSGDTNHPGKDFSKNYRLIKDAAGLREAIMAITHDPAERQRLLRARRPYLDAHLVADGRAAERIASLAEDLAAGANPAPGASAALS